MSKLKLTFEVEIDAYIAMCKKHGVDVEEGEGETCRAFADYIINQGAALQAAQIGGYPSAPMTVAEWSKLQEQNRAREAEYKTRERKLAIIALAEKVFLVDPDNYCARQAIAWAEAFYDVCMAWLEEKQEK